MTMERGMRNFSWKTEIKGDYMFYSRNKRSNIRIDHLVHPKISFDSNILWSLHTNTMIEPLGEGIKFKLVSTPEWRDDLPEGGENLTGVVSGITDDSMFLLYLDQYYVVGKLIGSTVYTKVSMFDDYINKYTIRKGDMNVSKLTRSIYFQAMGGFLLSRWNFISEKTYKIKLEC